MLEVDEVGVTYRPVTGWLRFVVQTAASEPVRALDSVSFNADRGEVVGIIGPNGAGKSTLLRAITSLLIPTEGTIRIAGEPLDPDKPELRRRFGVCLPEDRSFHWRLTGRQNLEYFAALVGLPADVAAERIDRAMIERDLAARDKAVFGYSSGMLARLAIARALLHEPALLVLDEPTRSLDPVAGFEFCDEIRRVADQGRAVVFASHRLDDIVQACDRVIVLIDGRVTWQGSAAEIAADRTGLGNRLRQLASERGGEA